MNISIRQEEYKDYNSVFNVIELAFEKEELSDHREHFLVNRLRNSDAFIPELSLVAEMNHKVVGHILLTKLVIHNQIKSFPSLALAPVSVHPDYQGKGIGGKLILSAHKIAKELGYSSVILLGHADYYPRFGYKPTTNFNIQLPFEVPDENCMAVELYENSLKEVHGMVVYPKEFNQ